MLNTILEHNCKYACVPNDILNISIDEVSLFFPPSNTSSKLKAKAAHVFCYLSHLVVLRP